MGILANYVQVFRKASPYSLYVLIILLLTYMLNQLDRYALSIANVPIAQSLKFGDQSCMKLENQTKEISKLCTNITQPSMCENFYINTTNGTFERVCKYDYNGQGIEYQILAGPTFIVVFTFTGIVLSIFADKFQNKRVLILSCCLAWWSVMTILTGLVNSFWQLAILRFGLGFGEAGCNPLATALIADYFSIELRGAALGIYNWGIYTGYSLSFAIGNQVLKYLNWHWLFVICGAPGILISIVILLTIRQPNKDKTPQENSATTSIQKEDKTPLNKAPDETNAQKFKKVIKEFAKPSLLILCLAGSIRNAAGYVWGYNNNTYYKGYDQTPDQISSYLGVIPLVFGIIGSFVGGFVSDRVAKQAKPWIRVWVLVISQIVAAPFVFGVLFFPPPASYYFLIPSYIFGEMWVGVCLSVVVELVPERLRTTGIGVYFFIISNIGGNMQVIFPPVQKLLKDIFKLTDREAFRGALFIFYPGFYVLGSLLFLLTLFVLKRDLKHMETTELSITNPLTSSDNTDSDKEAHTNKSFVSDDEKITKISDESE